jgi:ABC-2 type transport system permease protein
MRRLASHCGTSAPHSPSTLVAAASTNGYVEGGYPKAATRARKAISTGMGTVWATFTRSWTVTRRAYPLVYFLATLLIGTLTIGLAYVALHGIGGGRVSGDFVRRTGTGNYLAFVAVGAGAYMFTIRLMLWVSRELLVEQRGGTLGALLVAPTRPLAHLLGLAAFGMVSALLELAVLVGFASLLRISLLPADPLAAVVAVVVLTVAVTGMSIPIGCVMLIAGEAHITQNTVFSLIAVLCGFTFPISYLPEAVQPLCQLVPLTPAMRFLRGAFSQPDALGALYPHLFAALGLTLCYAVIGLAWLPRALRRAMERTY